MMKPAIFVLAGLLTLSINTKADLNWSSPINTHVDSPDSFDVRYDSDGYYGLMYAYDDLKSVHFDRFSRTHHQYNYFPTPSYVDSFKISLSYWGSMPVVTYAYDHSQNVLWSLDYGSWTSPDEIPDTEECVALDMEVSLYGTMHMLWVYQNYAGNCYLMYSKTAGSDWATQALAQISTGTTNKLISIHMDGNDKAHIAFYDKNLTMLRYGKENDSGGFDIVNLIPLTSCAWIDIGIINTADPVIAYIKGSECGDNSLHTVVITGGQYHTYSLFEAGGICDAELITNIDRAPQEAAFYVLMMFSDNIYCYEWNNFSWTYDIIPGLYSLDYLVRMKGDWNPDANTIGLFLNDPTDDTIYLIEGQEIPDPTATPVPPTPTPGGAPTNTPRPTSTPGGDPTATPAACSELGCKIKMPSHEFHPGDPCNCIVTLCNPGPETLSSVPVFVILDVYGSMYFAPSFSEFDYYLYNMLPPGSETLTVLPDFTWPEGAGTASGINFYAGMTNAEMTELQGAYDVFTFGWSE